MRNVIQNQNPTHGNRISQLPFFVAASEHRGLQWRLERSDEVSKWCKKTMSVC